MLVIKKVTKKFIKSQFSKGHEIGFREIYIFQSHFIKGIEVHQQLTRVNLLYKIHEINLELIAEYNSVVLLQAVHLERQRICILFGNVDVE